MFGFQQTKSSQAPDDELHIKSYCHAEFLRFLDGTAVGSFGTEDPTTNVLSISDDEVYNLCLVVRAMRI